ncbi:hypothetical protein C5167_031174 [Papaver somniferum]|nr:hypothetical protein C5167_031174 [Papaver somniferum]
MFLFLFDNQAKVLDIRKRLDKVLQAKKGIDEAYIHEPHRGVRLVRPWLKAEVVLVLLEYTSEEQSGQNLSQQPNARQLNYRLLQILDF